MAEDKKGFLLYADYEELFDELTDEVAGKLIKHILKYVNDKNPDTEDSLVKVAFIPIKKQLKRDLEKYEDKREQWSIAGKKSAESRKLKKEQTLNNVLTESTNVKSVATESTVNVNVNDNVIHNIHTPTKVGDIDFSILLETINKIFERKFAVVSDSVKKKYKTLLKQGYTKTHIHTAMLNCKKDVFHKDNDYKHCTIEYFSRPKTIDLYGTELITEKKGIVGTYTIHDHL